MTRSNPQPDASAKVPTRSLPEGALFVADDGVIYQVVLAGSAGFRKAKRWGGSDKEAVALVPDSPLAYHYPVIEFGVPLPRPRRSDLTTPDGQTSHYVFPNEEMARTAAYLDETLAWQSGCMARQETDRWTLTDGMHQFRVYHYEKTGTGLAIDLALRFEAENIAAAPYSEGPDYWAFLPKAPPEDHPHHPAPELPPPTSSIETPTLAAVSSEKAAATREQKGRHMILSVDIGYGYTKGIGPDDVRFSFPSVIGNAEEISFTGDLIANQAIQVVEFGGRRFFYGEYALLQSRLRTAIFDRSRTRDDTYRLLFAAVLAEFARYCSTETDLNVVTGLPVGFFSDRDDVVISLEGEYRLHLDEPVTFNVGQVYVVPQPFGSLFRELLNQDGIISNMEVEQGRIAVIDVGTFTTDFIVADALRYVQRLSSSIPIGWSAVLTGVQRSLSDRYRLDLAIHEVDKAIRGGGARVKGRPINMQPMLTPAIRDFEAAVIAKARDVWGEGADLDAILITGGAAQHLADAIQTVYPQARLMPDAFWANAEGFYRFAQRPATFGEA
jgi:plasmid segregation protein ParM